jgi:phthiodiolone/phenolphthiodiolone dimycocerosates ketoreductase
MILGLGVLPAMPIAYAESLVQDAEATGLDSVMVPDHAMSWFAKALWPDVGNIAELLPSPHVFLDPFPTIAAWAAKTDRLRFATAVTDPIRRSPAHLAITALSMSHLTKGRFILGIGCGEAENCLPYGLPFDRPVSRLEEALTIIRQLWIDHRVSRKGQFWSLDQAICDVEPYGGRLPPIWVGAHGPRMLELTGRYGDGWLPFLPMTPERYAQRLAVVRRSAERAGRDPAAILAGLNTPVCMAESHDQAHAMLASPASRQLALVLDAEFYGDLGLQHPLELNGVLGYVPEWLSEEQLRAALAAAPDPMVAHDLVIHGTPADVVKQLRAFEDAGLEYFAPLDTSPFTGMGQMPFASRRMAELKRRMAVTESR